MKRRGDVSIVRTVVVALLTLPFIYPFVFMLSTAVKTERDYLDDRVGLPSSFTLDHLTGAWKAAELGQGALNSLIAVGVGVVLCCLISSTAAFWLYRHTTRFAKVVFAVIVGVWLVPLVVWLMPFFVLLSDLNLTNNLVVLGVVYATVNAPFATYLMWSYYRNGIPREVTEAAEVDGASLVQQFVRIVVPLSAPGLATVAALSFVFMWGELLLALVLIQEQDRFPLVPAAANLVSTFDPAVQRTAAAAVITIIPMLVVFLLAQRAIVRGFTAGVSK